MENRLDVAARIVELKLLADDGRRNAQLAWAAEAEDRIEAYRRGDLSAVDGPSTLKELRSRYRS